MNKSETIASLAAALAKAQSQVDPAIKDSDNPFFKSKYADVASVLDACEKALADNELAIVQFPIASTDGGAGVETIVMHSSGEWISNEYLLPAAKVDPQGYGSAITYARRYAYEAVMRIRREDDDGNAASGHHAPPQQRQTKPPARPASEPAQDDPLGRRAAEAIQKGGTKGLTRLWEQEFTQGERTAFKDRLDNAKKAAAKRDPELWHDEVVAEWTNWLTTNPSLSDFNGMVPKIVNCPPTAKPIVWAAIEEHAERNGLEFDKAKKLFFPKKDGA